ncbi:hypothetical protein LSH36_468g04017 [Paralvinella palmiformis]|uniref:STAS domain-containing protein n=1 Tax=Paralvinella palmiformis TaxID=53620 RepID=A0AAD9MZ57_9ANNE|nr:hypothetical protein LSH36_468g04017 [Paralvinella palmiformis]
MRKKKLTFVDPEPTGQENIAADIPDADEALSEPISDHQDANGVAPNSEENAYVQNRLDSLADLPDLQTARQAFTQEMFDESFQTRERRSTPVKEKFRQCCNVKCSGQCVKKTILGFLPFITWLRNYNIKTDLVSDILAGLLVGIMTIPQGTFAVISIMISSVLEKSNCEAMAKPTVESNVTGLPSGDDLANNISLLMNTNGSVAYSEEASGVSDEVVMCKVKVATAVTFVTGIIQLCMGLCKLGFVTIYLSYPLSRGLTTAASIYVFTSQIKHIFGISINTYNGPLKLVYTYIDVFKNLPNTNPAAIITSIVSIVIMVLIKELASPKVKKAIKMPIPIELIFVILGTVVSYFWKMRERFRIDVVGLVPTGIPPPSLPPPENLAKFAVDGVSIALVSFALNASLVTLFSKKYNYKVNINQELIAYGVGNSVSSFFNCYVSGASLSRSMVHDGVGGKTQCILAAIVIVNLKGMFLQFKDLKALWVISKYDFMDWLVVFVAVILLNVDLGLGVGLAFSLLSVIFRTQRPYTFVLGRVPGTDLYKNIDVYPSAKEIPGLKIFRFEASLYFANNEHFVQKLFQKSGVNPRKLVIETTKYEKKMKKEEKAKKNTSTRKRKLQSVKEEVTRVTLEKPTSSIKDIIIDCTTMAYIDFMGVRVLSEVITEYKKVDITVYLAGCKVGVREMLESAGFYENIPRDQLFVCVHDAVLMLESKYNRKMVLFESYCTTTQQPTTVIEASANQ